MKPTKKRTRLPLAILSLVFLFGVIGCSKGTVTGKVTYDDKTVPVGTVTFYPDQSGKQPILVEIENGQYKAEKVPPGSYTITVSTAAQRQTYERLKKEGTGGGGPLNPTGGGGAGGGQAPGIEGKKKDKKEFSMPGADDLTKGKEAVMEKYKDMIDVPAKYADPEKSGLKFEVKSGSQDFNIDIPKG